MILARFTKYSNPFKEVFFVTIDCNVFRNLPSLKAIARDGILHHGAGESLLAIISVGIDSLSITLDNDVR